MNAAVELIREEIEARDWTPAELARRMQCPLLVVEELLREELEINPANAAALGKAFGTSAKFWLNLGAKP